MGEDTILSRDGGNDLEKNESRQVVKQWTGVSNIASVGNAPRIIDFGSLWKDLFKKNIPEFSKNSETAWGFNENSNREMLYPPETSKGAAKNVSLNEPHTLDIHTEPGHVADNLKKELPKRLFSRSRHVTDTDIFKANLPKHYLPDVSRLLKNNRTKASIIIRMTEDDLWPVTMAIKTGDYTKPSDNERVGNFGRFGWEADLKYNLSFDDKLKKLGVAVYRGFIQFPFENDKSGYLRIR